MRTAHGFSLIEMAFVLVIITLLLGGLLVPFATQVEQRRIAETNKAMEEIKEALLGYAIANGQLPCPDTNNNGTADACPSTATTSSGGNIPWVDLGVANADAWGQRFQYRVNGAFTTTISLSPLTTGKDVGANQGILRVCTDSACTAFLATNVAAVVYSLGKNGQTFSCTPVPANHINECENRDNDRDFVSTIITNPGAVAGEFDDLVTWLSPNILFNRMVAAGKLPN